MGDILLGLVGLDYVLIAADQAVARSIVIYKQTEDKIAVIDNNKLLGCAGPVGDRTHFCEYIEKNIHLYSLRTGIELSTAATANFTRNQLAEALRSSPYQVNLLIGGYDAATGPSLYYMDYIASMHQVPNAAHGYAGYFALSIFDRYYKPDLTLEEGLDVIRKCIAELELRFLLKVGPIKVKIANKDGIKEMDL